jgi:Domain of unknown function (DUF4439)
MSASPTPAGGGSGAPARGTAGAAARATGTPTAIRALQAALTAEHAAIYGYGVAGAHLTGARQKAAASDWAVHEAARDTLAAMITALGAQPVAAATAYRLPFPVRGEQAAITLAAYLEDRVTTAYLGLVALSETRLRAFGARAAQSAALRATSWRGRTLAFPGLVVPALGPVPSGPGATGRTPGPSAPGGAVPSTPPTG